MRLVDAYQARRILDRLVGFKWSPLLWKYIDTSEKGLSAGRCQSALLLILSEHQRKIQDYTPEFKYELKYNFIDLLSTIYLLSHGYTILATPVAGKPVSVNPETSYAFHVS